MDVKSPDETRIMTFDFSSKAPAGAVLSNPTVAVRSVLLGRGVAGDLDVEDTAGPTVEDLTVTTLVSAGTNATRYRLRCEVDCDNGEHYEVDRDLMVSAASVVAS